MVTQHVRRAGLLLLLALATMAAFATVAQAESVELGSGTVDNSRVVAPRWVPVLYTPDTSGPATLVLDWTGDGNLAFDVRVQATGEWLAANTSSSTPKEATAILEAGVEYRIGVWSRSGVGDFTMSLAMPEPPGEEPFASGTVDADRAVAPKWIPANYLAVVGGETTFTLTWEGSAQLSLDVRRVDDNSWVGSNGSATGSPKQLTVDLVEGTLYRVGIWATTGTATFELAATNDASPPTTTSSSSTTSSTSSTTSSTTTTSSTSTTTTTSSTTTTTTTTPPVDPDRPNIIIINVDDARPEVLSVMPLTEAWFGDQGTDYTDAFITTPSCCPSRATLMTGQYVHNNGQVNQNTDLTNQDQTIQRYLHDAGYFTGHSGKFLHYVPLDTVAPHWDRWAYYKGGYENVPFNIDGEITVPDAWSTTTTFDQAIDQLESFDAANDAQPFYLHIAPTAPHSPFTPEPQFANAPIPDWDPAPSVFETDRSDKPVFVSYLNETLEDGAETRAAQLRMMMSVDVQIDRLMTRLDELGEADNTIAIFTSDNGYFWSEHGRRSKFLPYREAIHVPFLMRWPGEVAAGAESDQLVSHVDILPTVLSAAGVTPGHTVDGQDILAPGFARTEILTEYFEDPDNANFITDWASLRNDTRAYTEYRDSTTGALVFSEYYDLVADPYEMTNLLADGDPNNDPDITADAAALASARDCVGGGCP